MDPPGVPAPQPRPVVDIRHALSNPLAALLTEAQMLLTGPAALDEETRRALREIEQLALRMRTVIKESYRNV